MLKLKSILALSLLIIASSILNIKTSIASIVDEGSFKVAAVYWLPDYSEGRGAISNEANKPNSGGGTEKPTCANTGGVTSIPDKKTCSSYTPGYGIECYKNCVCKSQYKYNVCPEGKQLSTDCCDGKCTACNDCTPTRGWSYTKPSVDDSRIRVINGTCGRMYLACELGYKPSTNALLGDSHNLKSCPSHQNWVTTGGGVSCAKCENKSCADYGYQDTTDTTKNCQAVYPFSGKTCYNCIACESQYQYTTSNCTTPRSVAGQTCGGKYNQCNCPTGVTNCSNGCQEYYASPCGSVCKTCKTYSGTPKCGYWNANGNFSITSGCTSYKGYGAYANIYIPSEGLNTTSAAHSFWQYANISGGRLTTSELWVGLDGSLATAHATFENPVTVNGKIKLGSDSTVKFNGGISGKYTCQRVRKSGGTDIATTIACPFSCTTNPVCYGGCATHDATCSRCKTCNIPTSATSKCGYWNGNGLYSIPSSCTNFSGYGANATIVIPDAGLTTTSAGTSYWDYAKVYGGPLITESLWIGLHGNYATANTTFYNHVIVNGIVSLGGNSSVTFLNGISGDYTCQRVTSAGSTTITCPF